MHSPRSERDTLYVAAPDWWGRLLAIGAIAIAGAACYWSYLQYRDRSPVDTDRVAAIQTAVNDGVKAVRDEGTRERQRLESFVTNAVQQMSNAEEDPQRKDPQLVDNEVRPRNFEEPIAEPSSNQEDATNGSPSLLDPNELSVEIPSELIEVYAVMRADDMTSQPTLIIRNRGQLEAKISLISFEPVVDFDQVPLEIAEHDFGDSSLDRLVVAFGPEDNQASDPTAHGTYTRSLTQPFVIGPDREVQIQLVIANRAHVAFGLRGHLVLRDDHGNEIASFDNVSVPFVK